MEKPKVQQRRLDEVELKAITYLCRLTCLPLMNMITFIEKDRGVKDGIYQDEAQIHRRFVLFTLANPNR